MFVLASSAAAETYRLQKVEHLYRRKPILQSPLRYVFLDNIKRCESQYGTSIKNKLNDIAHFLPATRIVLIFPNTIGHIYSGASKANDTERFTLSKTVVFKGGAHGDQ